MNDNGTCAGTCFIYLRPTAMPVGLAGLNKNKIVLRAVLATVFINILKIIFKEKSLYISCVKTHQLVKLLFLSKVII